MVLFFAIATVALTIVPTLTGVAPWRGDFICYWASGQQIVHQGNPYDPAALLAVQRTAGYEMERPIVLHNLPNAFFLAWPLGFLGPKPGYVIWTLAIFATLIGSVRLLWTLNGRQDNQLHLMAYLFAPILACLMSKQVGIFMLLGITAFLYYYRTRPILAGSALFLCAIKLQLFLPFGIVLIAWAIHSKAYKILFSSCGAIAGSCFLSLLLDPHAWSQYARMMRETAEVEDEFIPTLSMLFRLLLHRDAVWLQFLPVIVASAWAAWYYVKHRREWDWMTHGLLLLVVSEVCSPHAWFTDEAVLLPAILTMLYRTERQERTLVFFGLLTAVSLIETIAEVPLTFVWYLWTAPAWFIWYMYAARKKQIQFSA